MTYLPLEDDARELVDLYYRVSPSDFLDMGSSSAILLPPIPLYLLKLSEEFKLTCSERQKWSCFQVFRSRRSSDRLRYEHPNQDDPPDWIVRRPFPLTSQGRWLMTSCVTLGLMCAAVVPMFFLVNSTPNDIPADVIAAEIEARRMEEEFPEKEKTGASQVREV